MDAEAEGDWLMGRVTYNKIVRDKIPEIISDEGKQCIIEILNEDEYLMLLDTKLDEELGEYHLEHSIEELADLVEVIYATVKARGCSIEEFEKIRMQKAETRGAFEKRILLKEVIDDKTV